MTTPLQTAGLVPSPRQRRSARIGLPALAAGLVIFLGACASTPPPTEQMAVANAALANAVTAGGPELAPTEMGMARDKMTRANLALAAKENDRALALAQQAQVDAQVAAAKAEASKARKAADAMQQASQALREEMARKTPTAPN